jgi:ribosomal protein S18 acetylase RimI-like enzyme
MPDCCEYLDWDSEFFGLRAGRVSKPRLESGEDPAIREWCRQHSIDCLYFLSDDEPESRRMADATGFQLVDVRITLEAPLESSQKSGRQDPRIRPARPDDVPALRQIAGRSHTDSRFYHDGHFESSRCDELYRIWIEKSCAGWADLVLVAEHQSRPAGYVTATLTGDRGQIGLIAVDDAAQGVGLGRALVEGAFDWMRSRGAVSAWVVTQERNEKALRFYYSRGFVQISRQYWYHLWPQKTCR